MNEIILKRRRYSVFCKYSSRERRERDSRRCRGEKQVATSGWAERPAPRWQNGENVAKSVVDDS
ncbi:MAG TPA: hypothetical protein VIF40_09510 [Methylosinus sp.]|jgi:hypothetical protein|uniref:hypothetical protein n=1 Tax=Methylosinus sp. TaxID=427 RepID=UPI002F944C2A